MRRTERISALALGLVVAHGAFDGCSRSSDAPAGRTPTASSATAASSPPAPSASVSTPQGGRGPDLIPTSAGDLRVVPIHHGTILFEFGGKEFWVDPFHEGNLDGHPPADFIFITHAHPDHLDPSAIEKIRKSGTVIVAPPSVAEKLDTKNAAGDSTGVIVLKVGEKQTFGGVGVEAVAMYNLKRGPVPGKVFHEKGWGEGFVLTFGDKRVYVSGDTECTPEMRALKDIDVAFLCMNLPYTMTPHEAGECAVAFKPKILYPYHYRGSDLGDLEKAVAGEKAIELRERDWY